MIVDDVLYSLDTIWNSEALDPKARDAARYAYRHLIAFKCARKINGLMHADRLSDEAWATESNHVPAN